MVMWLLMLLAPRPIVAHGLGRQQLERVPVGDYRVTVWTDPVTVRTNDELHVTVAVEDEGGLVLEMDVEVIASHVDQEQWAAATHENAVNKLHYEAPFRLEQDGIWQITIVLRPNIGEASFELEVEPAERTIPWRWIVAGLTGLLVIGLIVINRRNEVNR